MSMAKQQLSNTQSTSPQMKSRLVKLASGISQEIWWCITMIQLHLQIRLPTVRSTIRTARFITTTFRRLEDRVWHRDCTLYFPKVRHTTARNGAAKMK
jgi:hypothetical protein